MRIVCAVGLFFLIASCGNKKQQNPNVKEAVVVQLIDSEFEEKLGSTSNAQLIDVRSPQEFNDGYIKGAININYQGDNFAGEIEKLDKTKPTFVYCQSGGRSKESCNYMKKHGFTIIYELKGGFGSWSAHNKPFEQIKSDKPE